MNKILSSSSEFHEQKIAYGDILTRPKKYTASHVFREANIMIIN